MQGLPFDFDLPSFNVAGKKKLIGNGVPLSVGRVLAKEVAQLFILSASHLNQDRRTQFLSQGKSHESSFDKAHFKRCNCSCGRKLIGRKKYYDSSCRKRAQRVRNQLAINSHE